MVYLVNKAFDLLSWTYPEKKQTTTLIVESRLKQAFNSVLGICSAVIIFPVIYLAVMFSVFVTDEKWEEFWDKFLE